MDTTIRILYAEDDADGAKLTKMILEKENFEVEIVLNGAKAWDAYKKQKPDILLVDLDMPKIDGLELTRMIRENDRQTHLIVYLSWGTRQRDRRARRRSRRIHTQRLSRSIDRTHETPSG